MLIIETRGAKPKYNFEAFKVGETRMFHDTSTGQILNCAKSYCKQRDLKWKFRCFTIGGVVNIVRIK